jgi:hypothetical protein
MSAHACIRRELLRGKKLTQLGVLRDFGVMRLAAVIHRLRREGLNIETGTRNQRGKTFAVYRLAPCEKCGTLHHDAAECREFG